MTQVPLTSPIKGIVRAVGRESQPPDTCFDALNCLPYDRYGRKRLAQRTGIVKQFPSQLADNFVQGMIEAPNIIYPPGTLAMDVPIIMKLADPFTFSGPTAVGPLTAPMPTAGATVLYEWDFSITYTFQATPTLPDPDWSDNGEVDAYFYWPLGSGPDDDLILRIICSCLIGWNGGGTPNGVEANLQVISGDVTDSGTWSDVIAEATAPVYGTTVVSGGTTSTTFTVACTIQINSNGNITINMTPNTSRPGPTTGVSPITQTEFPELALHEILFFDSVGSIGSSGVSTLMITDG